MPRVVLSTCGTSLLGSRESPELAALLREHANATEIPRQHRERLDGRIAAQRVALRQADPDQAGRLSAELKGVVRFYGSQLPGQGARSRDMHYLVATDTYLGRAAADLVAEWLGQRFVVVQRLDIQDLRVDDPDSFRLGMSALAEWCASTLPGFRSAGHAILFNLTGGFKPVQAFLQTLGMFHADESFYVFEGAETPMRIPRLPIRLDIEDSVRRNLEAFRRLDRQEELPASDCADVPETLLGRVGDRVALSPWGALAFKTARPAIFGAALLDPLSERVVYSNRFRDEVRDLAPDRREALNVQLDRLSRHLEGGENPRSLQFKALSGDPRPPSTHEAYAWSDRDARRILGHFEGARFVIDQLSVHL